MDNYNTARIKYGMSGMDIMTTLADGNPGAITALLQLRQAEPIVDPNSAWKGYGPMFTLDTNGVYGSRIWMIFKDVCGQDPALVIALLRARQLGFLTTNELDFGIDNYGQGINIEDLVKQVTDYLDNFNVNALTDSVGVGDN
jgi:hypothetical protein